MKPGEWISIYIGVKAMILVFAYAMAWREVKKDKKNGYRW